ncbi:HEPN domain-containing protein [Luteimonas huabeiensis]|uniref:HEPN domain-containing protein n=1 Tax=Luteimonas huabeiensis TaxID=1244513 RepID=UPI001268D58F|nr:HEPN domain-containing protein [Luteimonas huabeiensis]
MKAKIQQRITGNITRVRNLIQIYETHLMGKGSGRRGHLQTDVLRAATVFLHASLEDFLRSIAYWKLPDAGKEVIDKIPLAGLNRNASKFSLGELVAHKGKTVDNLIKESVDEYLERSNYNNTEELALFLSSVGMDPSAVNSRFSDLEALMSRRHQIVHRGDIDESGGRGNSRIRSLGRSPVGVWISAVEDFSTAVLARL